MTAPYKAPTIAQIAASHGTGCDCVACGVTRVAPAAPVKVALDLADAALLVDLLDRACAVSSSKVLATRLAHIERALIAAVPVPLHPLLKAARVDLDAAGVLP